MANHISDISERERALNPAGSFAVQAPAGSGKTELLMQRYLALLSTVERPEEILALTFTRKAAGEMQGRIIASLNKANSGVEPKEPHEMKTVSLAREALKRNAEKGWGLLQNPGRLKIQTIDSFSASLIRQMPLLSRIGGLPSIEDKPEELYREAARRTVLKVEEDGRDGDSVRGALRHLDNSIPTLTDRLVAMLGKRDQWLRHVKSGFSDDELRAVLEGSFERLIEDKLKRVKSLFPKAAEGVLAASANFAAANLTADGKDNAVTKLSGMKAVPGCEAKDLPLWKGIKEMLVTDKDKWRKPKGINVNNGFPKDKTEPATTRKREFLELLESLSSQEALLTALSEAGGLPHPKFDDGEWEILSSLLHLLPIAEGELNEIFAGSGKADFQAVSMAAIDSLGPEDSPTDLMLSLDLRIRHILVDEYQDTSRTQLALIEALTRGWEEGDGRTIFVVGDPMQSIYLFREAEVGLFLDARINGIGNKRLEPLTLSTNFRSQSNIVGWVNGSFAEAFPSEEDVFTGSVTYSPSVAVKDGLSGDAVTIRLFDGRDDLAEAREAVSFIKAIDKKESIAVLCRSRLHLLEIVDELKKEGIGFRAQQIDSLPERPVIQDLFSLLRAVFHPYDRVAWLSILRAPWCGLGLSDLHALCLGDSDSPVWGLLDDEARFNSLSDDGKARLNAFREKMGAALEATGRMPLRDLLEGLWIGLGGPACLESEALLNDAEEFFGVIALLDKGGAIDSIEAVEERIKGLYADHGGSAGVNLDIMTIHKAKGLEFDHVILPGLGKKTKADEKKLLVWLERGDDLLLAPIEKKGGEEYGIYKCMREISRKKSALQDTRLFYVAATRARKKLYLLGHVKFEDSGIEADSQSFLSLIGKVLREDMVLSRSNEAALKESGRPLLKRLPAGWSAPGPLPPVFVHDSVEEVNLDNEPEFRWAGTAIRHLGTVVHRYLCRIADDGLSLWDVGKAAGEKGRIKAVLMGLGLGAKEAEERAGQAVGIISKALADGKGRWALSPHTEGAVEAAVTGVLKGEIIHAVIDRTFIEGDVRWVIDYKTSLHEGGSIEEFLENERERYRAQLEKYALILKAGGETRQIKKGLYYPALSGWIDWE